MLDWNVHVEDLLRQADSKQQIDFDPVGPRILVHPLMIDSKNVLEIVRFQTHLPDLGLVLAVSWEANEKAIERLEKLTSEQVRQIAEAQLWQRGQVVCVNRFSGMNVPGTELMVYRTDDVYGKVRGLPLRLKGSDQRKDEEFERVMRERDAPKPSRVVVPAGI